MDDEDYDDGDYPTVLMMLEVFEYSENWESLHSRIYRKLVSAKMKLIEQQSEARKVEFERTLLSKQWTDLNWALISLCSCNVNMMLNFKILADLSLMSNECSVRSRDILDVFQALEPLFAHLMSTNADRTYNSQFLIFSRRLDRTISILKDVAEQEGAYSISMVIWPRELYESRFIDENLRNELIKSSEDYVVFPTNLYARYLLTIAYSSLGQEENRSNNLAELIVLRERYSEFQEFAPMLKIMSTVIYI